MNCSETVEFIYSIVLQTYTNCGRINMQINYLGAVVTRELDVSPVTHKTEICSVLTNTALSDIICKMKLK